MSHLNILNMSREINNINENILNKHNLVITSSFIFDRKLKKLYEGIGLKN